MRILNDEELNKLYDDFAESEEENWERFLNKAIIKDFIEWGDTPCHGHPHPKEKWGLWIEGMTRRNCPKCWDSLKQLSIEPLL